MHVLKGTKIHFAIVNFLVLISFYDYTRHKHWEEQGEGYKGPLCTIFTTTCESTIIPNQK